MQKRSDKLGAEQLLQLAWWEEQASQWPVAFILQLDTFHLSCEKCGRSIMKLALGQNYYKTSLNEMTAQTVAHLRQFHREVGADGREDSKMGNRDAMASNSREYSPHPD